jgi:serine/threonine protein kinase
VTDIKNHFRKQDMSSFISSDSFNSQAFSSTSSTSSSSSGNSSSSNTTTTTESRYNQLNQIGKGGMGVVFLVQDTKKQMKLKAMKKVFCEDVQDLNRAMSEVWPVRQLNHENVVIIEDVYFENNNDDGKTMSMCMIMDYFEDGDLYKDILTRQSTMSHYTNSEMKDYMEQLVTGLKYIHKNNIIHRDLKPMNIFKNGKQLKIADFGLAKNFEESVIKTMAGTQRYMSPEIMNTSTTYNEMADIWSLGATFYEMMTLNLTFVPYLEVFMNKNFYQNLRSAMEKVGQYSPELIDIILDCLQTDQTTRPSAASLENRLRSLNLEQSSVSNTTTQVEQPSTVQSSVYNTQDTERESTKTLWMINPETKQAVRVASSPQLDAACSIVYVNSSIYIVSDYIYKYTESTGGIEIVSQEKGWINYRATVLNNKIYLISEGGTMFSWNPLNQTYQKESTANWTCGSFCSVPHDNAHLFIYCGKMYKYNVSTQAYVAITQESGWQNSTQATGIGNTIYTIDGASGKIWGINVHTADYHKLSDSNWKSYRPMVTDGTYLYTIGGNAVYKIQVSGNGAYEKVCDAKLTASDGQDKKALYATYDTQKKVVWCIAGLPEAE